VGHYRKLEAVKSITDMTVAGSSYYKTGIPNCVNTSKAIAEQIAQDFQN
jgi:hypothetical protein